MAKKNDWLADFAESQKAKLVKQKAKTVTASKKAVAEIQKADMIIIAKDRLPKAVNGNTVKYKDCKWKVVNASYKDAKGTGIVLKRIADKQLTDAADYARNEQPDLTGLDYNVTENSEVPKFTEEAAATEQEIASEDAVDRTTPAGRTQEIPQEEALDPMAMEMGTDNVGFEDVDVEPVEEELPAEEEAPVEEEATETVEEPVEEAAEEVVEEPATEEIEEVSAEETPVEEETTETVEEPAEEVAEEPVEEVVEEPASEDEVEIVKEPVVEDELPEEVVDEAPVDKEEDVDAEDDLADSFVEAAETEPVVEDDSTEEDEKKVISHQIKNRILRAMLNY